MTGDYIDTERLRLRPSSKKDAFRAFEIRSDWEVARMLSMAEYPPVLEEITAWFGSHGEERKAGSAYRFAVDHNGKMIGLVDLDRVSGGEATLGYWLARSAWGQGFAFEAAQALVRLAFDELGLVRLKAGHAADNPASGRILARLGFRLQDKVFRPSKSRSTEVEQWRYLLVPDKIQSS